MNERKRMNLYWKYVAEQNADELLKFFHEKGVIRWHCTNEQFTVPEFIKANCEYPGRWNGEMERMSRMVIRLLLQLISGLLRYPSMLFHFLKWN